MAHKLYSETLQICTTEIMNPILKDSLSALKTYLREEKLNLLKWSENLIAISLSLKIQLPAFSDIDIRETEEILIVINPDNYPNVCPKVYTDRLDFPKNKLAHLYIAKNDRPPAFCLIKGDMSNWYANKHLKDLVIRTKHWLSDAASDSLSDNNNQFDPIRLEGYSGTIVYKYHEFAEIVNTNKSFFKNSNFSLAVFENISPPDESPSFIIKNLVEKESIAESLKEYKKAKEKLSEDNINAPKMYVGYLVWSVEDQKYNEYNVNLPKSWKELKNYCSNYNINLEYLENFICELKLDYLLEIPLIVAIKRPKQLIGFNSNIEFINFYLVVKVNDKDNDENKIKDEVEVKFQSHNEPLSISKAEEISGTKFTLSKSMIFGCGALGSKIIMHFIRNGYVNFLLIDPDEISPHNMVRHGLTSNYIGVKKSTALIEEAKKLFSYDKIQGFDFKAKGELLLSDDLPEITKTRDWLFDFTASESFMNTLINAKTIINPKICRVIISDSGNKGILYLEGKKRNPRLDDLQASLYYKSIENPKISKWLQNEYESHNNNQKVISVGVGCNSETTILSDERISLHASYLSGTIKKLSNIDPSEKALNNIFISNITDTESDYDVNILKFNIPPFDIYDALNDKSWQIRYGLGIIDLLMKEKKKAKSDETGGVFIGCINYKTKTIHVLDIITAPPDSKASPVCFFRGTNGLPDKIKEINIKSGFQIGYVGEWHTHPHGPNGLSETDMATIKSFKGEFSTLTTPMPVFITVLAPKGVLPYVY